MNIRPATIEDVPTIVSLGAQLAKESPRFGRLQFSAASTGATMRALLSSPDGFLMVAEEGGQIVGAMAAIVSQHWMSTDRVASDLALFVVPSARGGNVGGSLAVEYLEWARKSGAVLINVGVSTGIHTEATARMYELRGFNRCGVLLEA